MAMRTGKRLWIWLGGALLVVAPAPAEELVVKVIPLKYRTAADLVDVLLPLAGAGGAVTGVDTRLVVKAAPAALAEIEEALRSLDTMPRSLWITVSHGRTRDVTGQAGGVSVRSGTTTIEAHNGVETRTSRTAVTGAFGAQSITEGDEHTETLRGLEGYPAFIRAGRAVAVMGAEVVPTPAGSVVASGPAFVESGAGFYVRPRLSGDVVRLELWVENTQGGDHGRVEGQTALTTLTGRLGEWIEVGGAVREARRRARSLSGSASAQADEDSRVRVRVEEIR